MDLFVYYYLCPIIGLIFLVGFIRLLCKIMPFLFHLRKKIQPLLIRIKGKLTYTFTLYVIIAEKSSEFQECKTICYISTSQKKAEKEMDKLKLLCKYHNDSKINNTYKLIKFKNHSGEKTLLSTCSTL